MSNRYANLTPSKKISEDFQNITIGFDKVQQDVDGLVEQIEGLDTLSPADREKLDGIEDGAQVNQNAFARVNDLEASNPSDAVTITGGTGITVTTNPNTKEVNVTATGEATPGPHGSAHLEFGSDPIPLATTTEGGLMSAADKTRLDGATSAATPNTIVQRDAQGRIKAAAPAAADDVARKAEVDAHLADYMQYKASRINLDLIGSVKYGKIELPEDFNHNLDFDLWRDPDGIIRHNFDLDAKIDGWTTYYVSENGDQSKDGLTPETAKKSLSATIGEIEADDGVTSAKIIVLGNYLTRTYAATVQTVTKNYAIIAQEDVCYIGSIEAGLTWTAHTAGVYYASRTNVRNVFDSRYKGAYNLPMRLEKKEALADCESTPGTWYTDGSLVYVHLLDGSPIDNSKVFVTVNATTNQISFGADKLFIMKGFTHLFGGSSQPCYFSSVGTTKGNVILDSVTIFSSEGNANGISCNGIKSIWSFNCKAFDIGRDGFNYHSVIDGDTFAFEYYCLAENCGLNDTNNNNNATTAHEGIRILRVGSKGKNTKGPVLADVNGCYSICVDCSMDNSLLATPAETRAAFYFGDEANKGKAILINCSGGDVNTKGINCDESFKAAGKITIDNFQGRNIPDDINFTIV